jgi:MinD-like ATPase involved in chromosome partitioning or flagellar assembly
MPPSALSTPPRPTQLDALLRDTATRDRRAPLGGGVPTLLCASGRGGSGTSLVAALLAVAAAGDGTRVLLIDGDDLVGPLAMLLGVTPTAGWQELRAGRCAPADVVTPISATLSLVAGGAPRITGAALPPLGAADRRACFRALGALHDDADLVVIDAGSRLDTIAAAIVPHGRERLVAVVSGADPIATAAAFALCKAVHARQPAMPLDVLANRLEGGDATRAFDAIDGAARQFLGTALHFAGAVPHDPTLDAAWRAGMPFLDAAAGSPAAFAAHDVALRALQSASPSRPGT